MEVRREEARRAGGIARRVPRGEVDPGEVTSIDGLASFLFYIHSETVKQENSNARSRVLIALADLYLKTIQVSDFEQRIRLLEEHYASKSSEAS